MCIVSKLKEVNATFTNFTLHAEARLANLKPTKIESIRLTALAVDWGHRELKGNLLLTAVVGPFLTPDVVARLLFNELNDNFFPGLDVLL